MNRADGWRSPALLVQLVSGRWTLAVLVELLDGGRRYQELHDRLDGIAHKVLTDTLRRTERDGLITRHLDAEHIETATLYELTDLGRSLAEPLAAFDHWVKGQLGTRRGGSPSMGPARKATLTAVPSHTWR